MAVKGGDLVTVAGKLLIHRLQTAGPGQVNIPQTKIYELGNRKAVGTVYDIPDLSFPAESVDATAHMEALLCGGTFNAGGNLTDADGTEYDLSKALPLDVVQQFKAPATSDNPFDVVGSLAIPYLTMESVSYRFGLRDSASQTMTLRGDQIIYAPGSMYVDEVPGTNAANQVINRTQAGAQQAIVHDALPNNDDISSGTRYILSVTLVKANKRLIKGVDYTEQVAAGGAGAPRNVGITILDPVPTTETIRIVYASDTVATYPQASHNAPPATAAKPAAIRGRDIKVYIGGTAISNRWVGVQSVTADYRVNLDRDEEFGNPLVVGQDYDVPAVSGSVELKPREPAELIERVKQVAGVSGANESVGALRRVALPLDIVLHSPDDGSVLKTLHVPDARFNVPGFSARPQQKLTVTFNFESDGGQLLVYKGARP